MHCRCVRCNLKSLQNIRNIRGPKQLPWGVPTVTSNSFDLVSVLLEAVLHLVRNFLSLR